MSQRLYDGAWRNLHRPQGSTSEESPSEAGVVRAVDDCGMLGLFPLPCLHLPCSLPGEMPAQSAPLFAFYKPPRHPMKATEELSGHPQLGVLLFPSSFLSLCPLHSFPSFFPFFDVLNNGLVRRNTGSALPQKVLDGVVCKSSM